MKITRGYIQGAFDGEGHLSRTGHDQREWWVLGISNSDLVWLQAISKYLKARGYHPYLWDKGRAGSFGTKAIYALVLRRRAEIKRFINEFPPLMASRQKKAAEFLLWDRQYKRRWPRGASRVLKEAQGILEGLNG